MVVSGLAGDGLLDTYFAERNAHAHDLVDWAVSIGRLMEHMAEEERCQREGLPAPEAPAALKSAGYGQGREQPPIRDGIVLLNQVSDTGSTGYLFTQPIVRSEYGSARKLDELLGSGFACVSRSAAPELSDTSQQILDRIGARVVSLEGLTVEKGRFDRLFKHHETAIVRPDRLVFGHTDESTNADALIDALARKLSLVDA